MQPTVAVSFEPLISAVEAGQLLGVHPVTLLRWAREGRIPHSRLGRKVKFRVSELNSWARTLYTGSAVRVAQPYREKAHEPKTNTLSARLFDN
jgi:excisionase family DNA binding protein